MSNYGNFIRAALVRAFRTVCQTAVSVIGTSAVISAVDWRMVVSSALLAGLVSILTSFATDLPEAPKDGVQKEENA